MSARLTINYKVQLVALIGVLGFISYFFLSIKSNLEYQDLFDDLKQSDLQVMNLTNNINLKINEVETRIDANPNPGENELNKIYSLRKEVDADFSQLIAIDKKYHEDLSHLAALNLHYIDNLISFAKKDLTLDEMQSERPMLTLMKQEIVQLRDEYRVKRFKDIEQKISDSQRISQESLRFGFLVGSILALIMLLLGRFFAKGVNETLTYVAAIAGKIAKGDWDVEIKSNTNDETAQVLKAMEKMRFSLKRRSEEDAKREEEQKRLMMLSDISRGDLSTRDLCQNIMRHLPKLLGAQVGALYILEEDFEKKESSLHLIASYAFTLRKSISDRFKIGEGVVGQVALERSQVMLTDLPQDYLSISSSLGESSPGFVVITPLLFDDHLFGVFELGFIHEPSRVDLDFLVQAGEIIAQYIETSSAREKVQAMLVKTQEQAEKLEQQQEILQATNQDLEDQAMALTESESRLLAQQEELRVSNEELEEQAKALKVSEERLQAQQEELRVTNEELEEHTRALEQQKAEMKLQNEELERSRKILEEKTEALELSGQYKSEFMSTMSHELRTPLNSILILSENLAENTDKRLSDKQVEHARVINKAGGDLLNLINDILDLAKVEEGKLELLLDDIEFKEWANDLEQLFSPVSEKKGISFSVELDDNLPDVFQSDEKRLNQILKNLLSNALKFTEQGSVTLSVHPAPADLKLTDCRFEPDQLLAFSVKDTGLGIEAEKQNMIFEAFQQSDGAISRKYGGTGLGLTISNRLAKLLGGEITVSSEGLGHGSCFTLYVPKEAPDDIFVKDDTGELPESAISELEKTDPSLLIAPSQTSKAVKPLAWTNSLLIVEDDPVFAKTLEDLAREYSLEVELAPDGESALELAKQKSFKGIILDLNLPGMNGLEVMEQLQQSPDFPNTPIHVMSGKESEAQAMSMGAIDFLKKPASKQQIIEVFESIKAQDLKHLLFIEKASMDAFEQVKHLFNEQGVKMSSVETVKQAIDLLANDSIDCIIFDLDIVNKPRSPKAPVNALIKIHEAMKGKETPLIVYTSHEVDREQEAALRKYSDRVILKTQSSHERLISEASLFLHWLEDENISSKHEESLARDALFEGKRVLIVDDDMRNVYSLTSELERRGIEVEAAESGVECLNMLQSATSTFDIVLMDIMMPELDGFSTIEQIRNDRNFQDLPIIVLTAKSLKEDRARCMELGANDYLSKPIDTERLLALMRVWMT